MCYFILSNCLVKICVRYTCYTVYIAVCLYLIRILLIIMHLAFKPVTIALVPNQLKRIDRVEKTNKQKQKKKTK